jgi:methylated-DNA-protein-cysteine methyltransferase-like protein
VNTVPVTDHYPAIWHVVAKIPNGCLASYGQVAQLAGLPGYARWVGRALCALPEDSQLPWHRVVNSSGRIALASHSPAYQQQVYRLQQEGVELRNDRYDLARYQWRP